MTENDLYIIAMRYAYKHLEEGVTYTEVKEHLETKGFVFESKESINHYSRIFTSIFSEPRGKSWKDHSDPDGEEFTCYMDSDAYFKLMEYEELKGARKSSLHATIFASIAIVISIVSTFISIHYSKEQLNKPTALVDTQFIKLNNEKLESILGEIKSIEKSILIETKNIQKNTNKSKTHNKSLNRIGAKNAPPG